MLVVRSCLSWREFDQMWEVRRAVQAVAKEPASEAETARPLVEKAGSDVVRAQRQAPGSRVCARTLRQSHSDRPVLVATLALQARLVGSYAAGDVSVCCTSPVGFGWETHTLDERAAIVS